VPKEDEIMKVVPLDESAVERGIDLFNRGEYYDAHEAWEGLWFRAKDSRKKRFYQGLIMAAGAFVHAKRGECAGAAALLAKSVPLLRNGEATRPDLQLGDFIQALEQLGSQRDWCPAGAVTHHLPKILREYPCCEPHGEGLLG
jgi:predicted metal-dependent hydrolase